MSRKVNLVKYVKSAEGKWGFVPVKRSRTGAVEHDGREGSYYVDWREGGQRKRKAVGNDLEEALLAQGFLAKQLAQPTALGLVQILAAIDLHMHEAIKCLHEAVQRVEELAKKRKSKPMPARIVQISKIPVPRRNRHSALHDSQEWITTMAKITHGLKPNEALEITFSKKTLDKVKHAPRIFKKLLETFMNDNKIDYDVFQRGRTEEGTPIIYVSNPEKRLA